MSIIYIYNPVIQACGYGYIELQWNCVNQLILDYSLSNIHWAYNIIFIYTEYLCNIIYINKGIKGTETFFIVNDMHTTK